MPHLLRASPRVRQRSLPAPTAARMAGMGRCQGWAAEAGGPRTVEHERTIGSVSIRSGESGNGFVEPVGLGPEVPRPAVERSQEAQQGRAVLIAERALDGTAAGERHGQEQLIRKVFAHGRA